MCWNLRLDLLSRQRASEGQLQMRNDLTEKIQGKELGKEKKVVHDVSIYIFVFSKFKHKELVEAVWPGVRG